MTIRKLASLLAFKEGKKKQARISDIREILKLICEMGADAQTNDDCPIQVITDQTNKIIERRAKKKAKK